MVLISKIPAVRPACRLQSAEVRVALDPRHSQLGGPDSYGNTRGAMGIDTARYRNNSKLGIAIGNFANEMTALYVATKDPLVFTD